MATATDPEILVYSELDENLFQGILIVSCTPLQSPSELVKRIISNAQNHQALEFRPVLENGLKLLKFDQEPYTTLEPLRCHRVILDNKYYTTQIYLVELNDAIDLPERFYDYFHGVVIYFDNNVEDGLSQADRWLQYIENMENISIKVFACETANELNSNISRIEIQNYSVEKGFELIEFNPIINSRRYPEELDDEDGSYARGFKRLYQTIQAYVWPYLNYKRKGTDVSAFMAQTNVEQIRAIERAHSEDRARPRPPSPLPLQLDEDEEDEIEEVKLSDPDLLFTVKKGVSSTSITEPKNEEEADKFDAIFSQFASINATAATLEGEARRSYAEAMSIKFWNSISDDKDEIMGFSDSDDGGGPIEPTNVYI